MKNSLKLIALLSGLAAPAAIAWFANADAFSAETLAGSYTIAGLLFLTACSYSPARPAATEREPNRTWVRRSFAQRRPLRPAARA